MRIVLPASRAQSTAARSAHCGFGDDRYLHSGEAVSHALRTRRRLRAARDHAAASSARLARYSVRAAEFIRDARSSMGV
jgi:hypothetical protein